MKNEFRENHRQLFVSGVPADCCRSEIAEFFSRFGAVDSVEDHHTSTKTRALIVRFGSTRTLENILSRKDCLYFKDRLLLVQRYLAGRELYSQQSRQNRRRVIARKIPAGISLKDFRSWLESNFGRVETMFAFRTDHAHLRAKEENRNVKSYSILFSNSESSEKILRIGSFMFFSESHMSVFEKFKVNKKKNGPRGTQIDDVIKTPTDAQACCHQLDQQGFSGLHTRNNIRRLHDNNLSCFHHELKPTAKIYYSQALRSGHQREANLRFNKSG